jgi:hemerythrin-like domain-containing protein
MDGASMDRATAFGDELIRIHQHLRDTLDALRDDLESGAAPRRSFRSLQDHCVGFCAALTEHHTAEDRVAFPRLAEQYPELAPVLAELQHDHLLIAGVLRGVDELVGRLEEGADPQLVLSGLDGMSAILESHFRWEERRIVAALNSMTAPGATTREMFGTATTTLD